MLNRIEHLNLPFARRFQLTAICNRSSENIKIKSRRTFFSEEATVTAFSSRIWKRTVVVPTSSAATYFMILLRYFFPANLKISAPISRTHSHSNSLSNSIVKYRTLDRGVWHRLISINTSCVLSTLNYRQQGKIRRRNTLELAMTKN